MKTIKTILKILAMPFIFVVMLIGAILFGLIMGLITMLQIISMVFTDWLPETATTLFINHHEEYEKENSHNA